MKLTKTRVEALKSETKDYFVWDDEIPGFGVRVMPSGRKSYLVQYRQGGRTRRVTIAAHGVLTAEEARKRARALLGNVAEGGNPAEELAVERRVPNVTSLCDRFMAEHALPRCKPSTQKEYQRCVDLFIKPKIGSFRISDVTRADIAKLHHDMRHIPIQANRVLGVLSKMFNLADLWGLRQEGTNPCRLISRNRERRHERFLSSDELTRLGTVLTQLGKSGMESVYVIGAFRLLILTGCRLSEIQKLKWSYVQGNYLVLPDSKTGPRKIPLPRAARQVLTDLAEIDGNPYVIVGHKAGQHVTDMQKPWRRIRGAAGLEDVRIHDLRHTYASRAVMSGMSLPIVGKLLGHTQVQTTARYAHLADEPVREAAESVASGLQDVLAEDALPTAAISGNVVAFPKADIRQI